MIAYTKRHPELDERLDALLVSINDRLGTIVSHLGYESGQNITPLNNTWMGDIIAVAIAEQTAIQEASRSKPSFDSGPFSEVF